MLRRNKFRFLAMFFMLLAIALLPVLQALAQGGPKVYLPLVFSNGQPNTTPSPTQSVTPTTPPPTTPPPTGLVVKSSSFLVDENNVPNIIGEIQNGTSATYTSIRLAVTLFKGTTQIYTKNEDTLLTGPYATFANVLNPNQLSPFKFSIADAPSDFTSFEVTVAKATDTSTSTNKYTQFILNSTVTSAEQPVGKTFYRITFDVTNQGTVNLSSVELMATIYDATGKVIGVAQKKIGTMNAGATLTGINVDFLAWVGAPDATLIKSNHIVVYAKVTAP